MIFIFIIEIFGFHDNELTFAEEGSFLVMLWNSEMIDFVILISHTGCTIIMQLMKERQVLMQKLCMPIEACRCLTVHWIYCMP